MRTLAAGGHGHAVVPRASAPNKPRRSAADRLLLVSLALLPFTQALTVDLGFPLKGYELLIPVAALLRLVVPRPLATNLWARAAAGCAIALLLGTVLSLLLAVNDESRPRDVELYRFGASVDALLQVGYLTLAVLAMMLFAELVQRERAACITWWLWGAGFAAAYSGLVNAMSVVGLQPRLLPGASLQTANISGFVVYRASTFLEGNFVGLYLLASLVLALYTRRRLVGLLITVGLLLSLSTLSILGAAVMWSLSTLIDVSDGRRRLATGLALLPLVLLVVFLPQRFYEGVLLEKLDNTRSQSAIERQATAVAGLEMFADHPVGGVGIAQYGLWFPSYRPAFVPADFLKPGRRYIANNVYVQVAAEQGLLGLVPFLLLLGVVVRAAVATRSIVLVLGVTTVFFCLNAFPSVTVVFVWAFFGVILGLAAQTTPGARWSCSGQRPVATGGPA